MSVTDTAQLLKVINDGLNAAQRPLVWHSLSADQKAVVLAQKEYWADNPEALNDLLALVQAKE